jgi:hypothetical protein
MHGTTGNRIREKKGDKSGTLHAIRNLKLVQTRKTKPLVFKFKINMMHKNRIGK